MKKLNRFTYLFQSHQMNEIISSIKEEGYAIIENVLDTATLLELNSQIAPHLISTDPDAGNAFMGELTKRFGQLLLHVPLSRQLAMNDNVNAVCQNVLTQTFPTYQIHFTGVMHVMAGEKAQVLHRDISPFVNSNSAPIVVIAAMWAASDFTKENGATVFVPGSHKWDDARQPTQDELAYAEMKAGSVFLYAGNLIHGAGASNKGTRTGLMMQYCTGWMRQEENQYLIPINTARTFNEGLQKLMGYDLAATHWSYVSQQHPLDFLNHEKGRTLSPPGYNLTGRLSLKAEVGEVNPGHRYYVK
jgi:ectoine hydroxylase-related dioxygenase (phytanoyl-CoA dioxygenase family)